MKYYGIDLHLENSVVSVLDEQDHVVAEKRLRVEKMSESKPFDDASLIRKALSKLGSFRRSRISQGGTCLRP